MESLDLINNKKIYNSIDNKFDITKTYNFPSLSHKELISLNDLKHQFYYNSRQKREQNNLFNYHTEVLKKNFKGNSKFLSINNNLSSQSPNESKFPEIKNKNRIKKDKVFKLYMNQNIISNGLYNKNKEAKSKNVLKYNKTENKFNMSNISTKANFSLSVKNHNLSKFNKNTSISGGLNNICNLDTNTNKYPNKSNNSLNDNSLEQKITIFNFNDSSTSFPKYEEANKRLKSIDNFLLTKSNSNSSYISENINKKFLSNLNPIYSLLRNEFLSEFHRKTKNISYLKYFFRNKTINLELEKEKRISDIQKMDLNAFNMKLLLYFYNKFIDSKFEYLNFLKKTVTKEKEKNKILKEDKITIMNEIYTIRHKTLRLENRFKNYLNDKFFLLSVKNHSFSINNFTKEDQDDYNRDLKKLDILNIMLKITEKEYENKENENVTNQLTRKESTNRVLLSKISSKNLFLNNVPKSPIKYNKKQSTKLLTKKYYSLYDSKPILTTSQNNLLRPTFKAYAIYSDVKDFNRDLKQTSNNIQYSLIKYNKISKELQNMRYDLFKKKMEMKNLKKYEDYLKETIIFYKKNLENIKALNLNLQNYKNFLLNIDVLNLSKGLVDFKITKIVRKINISKDDILLKYLENIKTGNAKQNLLFIERAIEFLLNFKEKQKLNGNMIYLIIERKIEDKNRIKSSMFKQENT